MKLPKKRSHLVNFQLRPKTETPLDTHPKKTCTEIMRNPVVEKHPWCAVEPDKQLMVEAPRPTPTSQAGARKALIPAEPSWVGTVPSARLKLTFCQELVLAKKKGKWKKRNWKRVKRKLGATQPKGRLSAAWNKKLKKTWNLKNWDIYVHDITWHQIGISWGVFFLDISQSCINS